MNIVEFTDALMIYWGLWQYFTRSCRIKMISVNLTASSFVQRSFCWCPNKWNQGNITASPFTPRWVQCWCWCLVKGGAVCSFGEEMKTQISIFTILMRNNTNSEIFSFSVTEQTVCSQGKIRSPEHLLKLERWQGPPHKQSQTEWKFCCLFTQFDFEFDLF